MSNETSNYQKYKHNYNTKKINDWTKANKDRITIIVEKGERENIRKRAAEKGCKSVTEYITQLIQDDMLSK